MGWWPLLLIPLVLSGCAHGLHGIGALSMSTIAPVVIGWRCCRHVVATAMHVHVLTTGRGAALWYHTHPVDGLPEPIARSVLRTARVGHWVWVWPSGHMDLRS